MKSQDIRPCLEALIFGVFIVLSCAAVSMTAEGADKQVSESFETAAVRPAGGDYVPPPFVPIVTDKAAVRCLGRRYDLTGVVPMPTLEERPFLQRASVVLNGEHLTPPSLSWSLKTPAVAIAERSWRAGSVRISLRQTVEYDGFITNDLTLAAAGGPSTIEDLSLQLEYRPDASTLYHIPVFRPTLAGFWPTEMKIDGTVVGVWGGDDHGGFASYVATYRNWRNPGAMVILSRRDDGTGIVLYRVIAESTPLEAPVTYRFGFIATPVRPPERRHMQLYAVSLSRSVEKFVDWITLWSGLSDYYATFRTNKPDGEADKIERVREVKEKGKGVLAYTTYAHVEEGAVDVPKEWALVNVKGQIMSRSIGGGMADRKRVFLCPGSRSWVEWKMKDLETAVERYGLDGFYVDTSYIILPCANSLHGHGWVNAAGERQTDYLTWSMREIWRRSYEMLCKARGQAAIYAHHKSGCPSALAAFTNAFCDGEQYTGQSIKNLTLDAFRAEDAGRNKGPLAILINEYYRSAHFGLREKAEHHNPTESLMLSLLHDVLPTGYPGLHPVRELIGLRDDLGLADAEWTPYYAPDASWRAEGTEGVVISVYRTARGDTVLVVGNTTYEVAQVRLRGPGEAQKGRTFVAIDIFSRLGRSSAYTPGYRWERANPNEVQIGARSVGLFAFVRQPDSLEAFAAQHGFIRSTAAAERKQPIPKGAVLVSDFDDPDWGLANDDGEMKPTEEEPVDTVRALRVDPKPRHDAAALLRPYADPQDWRGYGSLTFWVRPDRPLPVRSFEVRLRNAHDYGPTMTLTSHQREDVLPAGQWTKLRYEFGDIPRDRVQILRIYYHRGELNSGPFDLDEVILHPADASPGGERKAAEPKDGEEDKPVPD